MRKDVILDTNFLVAPFQLSIDLFGELERLDPLAEIYTIEDVVQEAKSIEKGKYKNLVDKYLDRTEIEVLETEGKGSVDDLLVQLSDRYTVATNDKELKQRILERGNSVIIIRQKSYLELLGG